MGPVTVVPPPLSAKNVDSFAYPTMKDRIPVIISRIVDNLTRNRDKIIKDYPGEDSLTELKVIIGAMSQLRYEVMTNKPAAPLRDGRSDSFAWNTELKKETEKAGEEPKWFDSAWLWMECYMYRRVCESVFMSNYLKDLDVFEEQKQAAFTNSYKAISSLTMYLMEILSEQELTPLGSMTKNYFLDFLQLSLWGNKCDLSISAGNQNHQEHNPIEQLAKLKPFILIDQAEDVFQILCSAWERLGGQPGQVDIVLDNAGFELVTDLCLAEFLVSTGLASKICFHVKAMPWFVSDVTERDFMWTLKQMSAMNHLAISRFSQKWKSYLQDGKWSLRVSDYWTMPNDYNQMKELFPNLYSDLSSTDFILFKGDLNYRKLVGDLQWDPTTDFSVALRDFKPAPLCVLRTLKSDVVVGLNPGQAEDVKKIDGNWMINGEWAVISVQSVDPSTSESTAH
ncbi:protein-glutamate O-methyltransferase [Biomphalaria glabrata]|nr:protein-glutamate O-methyltransferase [Biomphalaria glabrata]